MRMWGIILALCQAARLGVCFSSLSCIFRDLLWSHWSMLCKRYILKVRLWEQFMERSVFFFPLSFCFHQFCQGPHRLPRLAGGKSPKMASVLLTNKSYQKVKKQQRLYEKWHKWKRSRIADGPRTTFPACLQPTGGGSPWRHWAAHTAESDAGDWTD